MHQTACSNDEIAPCRRDTAPCQSLEPSRCREATFRATKGSGLQDGTEAADVQAGPGSGWNSVRGRPGPNGGPTRAEDDVGLVAGPVRRGFQGSDQAGSACPPRGSHSSTIRTSRSWTFRRRFGNCPVLVTMDKRYVPGQRARMVAGGVAPIVVPASGREDRNWSSAGKKVAKSRGGSRLTNPGRKPLKTGVYSNGSGDMFHKALCDNELCKWRPVASAV